MHLTRMHLNPARRGTRHLVASPQRLHAAVLCGFPPGVETTTERGRVLWRLDEGEHRLTLYVSSPGRPDLTHLVEQAGWPTGPHEPWQTASTSPLLDGLDTGQAWAFRLSANPVHAVRAAGSDRGRPLAHVTVTQQRQWLVDRAHGWGFSVERDGVPTADVSSRRRVSFARHTDGAKGQVTLSVATYDGVLTVTDVDRLRHALGHGLGRAKGYGCGLLTLAPVR